MNLLHSQTEDGSASGGQPTRRRLRVQLSLGAALAVLAVSGRAGGQELRMTLSRAVAFAVEHHPSLHAQLAAEDAVVAQVDLARAGALPTIALSGQLEMGTGNVLRGALFRARRRIRIPRPRSDRVEGASHAANARC